MEDIVTAAIANLVAQNKQPSVALIKANVSKKVPMPVIIDVLSRYKQKPNEFEFSATADTPSSEQSDLPDPTQLDRIEAKLDTLIALLQKN